MKFLIAHTLLCLVVFNGSDAKRIKIFDQNLLYSDIFPVIQKIYSAHGDCYRAMTTSTDFFAKVLAATKTRKSHGTKFHRFKEDQNVTKTRFDNFKKNMKRLGLKFDLKGCKCHEKYKAEFQSFASDFDFKNPTGKISFK